VKISKLVFLFSFLVSCTATLPDINDDPAREFARRVNAGGTGELIPLEQKNEELALANNDEPLPQMESNNNEIFSAESSRGKLRFKRPSGSSSLWRESAGRGGMYHDLRAWMPMDLITVIISERSEGRKEADTQIESSSVITSAVNKLFGIETTIGDKNTQVTPSALLDARTNRQYDGQGETIRRDVLTGSISGMVLEVLPSGILRIEGKKITSVNGEEQVMVLSGLVRPRDVSSNNEVRSNQIANMRIDYYGNGIVSDVQKPGFITRLIYAIWPF
jgi:flagellar L-ring protein FlgH